MFTKQEKGFKILNDLNFFMFLCLSSYKIIYDNVEYTPKEFTSKFEDLVNQILPN